MRYSSLARPVSFAHVCGDAMIGAAAGLALYSAFPPLGWWWMTIPALALFISRIDEARAARAFAVTIAFGMSTWLPLINWVPMAVGVRAAWFVLACAQTLFLCAWVLFTRWTALWPWARGPVAQAIIYAITWTGVDCARSRWPWSGFPWGSVALPQVDSPLGHLAPYGGTSVVAAAVVFLAVLTRRTFAYRDAAVRREHWFSRPLLAVLVLAGVIAPAAIPLSNRAEDGHLRVGVVQGDIALPGLQAYSHPGEVTTNNMRASLQLATDPEVVANPIDVALWGEGSVDRDPVAVASVGEIVDEAARGLDAPILIGYTNLNERGRVKNWLALWRPGAGLDEGALYSKHVPVPFGEFIPFRSFIASFATEAAQAAVDMEAGVEDPLLVVTTRDGRSVRVAVGICFESAYPSVIGEGVGLGGQVIVTPSNNYHFRSSAESAQQGQLLRMRALEYGRSAIQASTTGHSYVIRPDGSVLASTDTEAVATVVADVPLRSSLTLTARAGEAIPRAFMAASFLVALAATASAVRGRDPKRPERATTR